MRVRLATAIAVGGLALLALPSNAATPKPQLTDPSGDANGINNQALITGGPSVGIVSPADVAAADITAVTFVTTYKTKIVNGKAVKIPNGFTTTMKLAAAPTMSGVIYRVSADMAGCDTSVFFEFATGGDTAVRCPGAELTDPDISYAAGKAVIKGSTITWKVSSKAIPVGTKFNNLNAQTRQRTATPAGTLTAPQYDYAASTKTYTVGR
jgi:hypothetical protein